MSFKELQYLFIIIVFTLSNNNGFSQTRDMVSPRHIISLNEAHAGSLEIDTMLLNSYVTPPSNNRQFYLDARAVFERKKVDFTNARIVEAALKNDIHLMGGPMLGDIKENAISIWFRPSNEWPIHIDVKAVNGNEEKHYTLQPLTAGQDQRIVIDGLSPSIQYKYVVTSQETALAEGTFRTTSENNENQQVRLIFGSGFHKIGFHNPNLINTIVKREPNAMMLLGDNAVDDRDANTGMHRSDYLLRDLSLAWKKLAANVPIYASWDDHDYFNNDLSGVPEGFTKKDRKKLRTLWRQNWNNPPHDVEGIYFHTQIGQVELIMLDTRSYREIERRGEYGSYLGAEQQNWLKDVLKNSTATFKIISSGTMWSDDISNGKDSWGTWDTLAREEIYELIETENIKGVLLISGDRHGARGFTILRPSGYRLFEFEAASLGGVPGPPAMASDTTNQLFGYEGYGLKAFGEFTFEQGESEPKVTFRLIDETGKIMEEYVLTLSQLTPHHK
mgnify:CR=1 FL=1